MYDISEPTCRCAVKLRLTGRPGLAKELITCTIVANVVGQHSLAVTESANKIMALSELLPYRTKSRH